MASKPIRFGVIGRSGWLFETLVRLVDAGHIPTFVITAREAPEYTKSAKDFETLATTLGVPFLRTSRLSSDGAQRFLDKCPSTDCVVSINFSSIISDDVIARYPLGILNAHGGDLPRYRGNACQAWAILAGEPKIAMCIHRMIGGEVDSGDIIARAYLPLNTSTKIGDIYHWFGETIPELYSQALDALSADADFVLEQQATNKSDALRCYPRRPEDGQINWRSSAIDIVRLVNASGRPFPGAYTFLDDRKVHIFEAEVVDDGEIFLAVPGQILLIDTQNQNVEVAAGKGKMRVSDFHSPNGEKVEFSELFTSIRQRFTNTSVTSKHIVDKQ